MLGKSLYAHRTHISLSLLSNRYISRFGFFFSYLVFNEVYPASNPFQSLDYHDYMTDEDMEWLTGRKIPVSASDSDRVSELEDKALAFMLESASVEIGNILREGIRKLDDPSLSAETVTLYQDSIKSVLNDWDFKSISEFIDQYEIWTGNPAVSKLHEFSPPIFEEFDKKFYALDSVLMMEAYREEVELPGLVTATNSVSLTGNLVSWDISANAFLLDDYVMYAESRVINKWAFILSGVVLLFLILLVVVKAFK